jgi:annexin A7/11
MSQNNNISQQVELIRKATKGWGTDEKALIDAIIHIKPEDLPQVDSYYKANYGKGVMEVIRSETSGNFGIGLAMACVPETYTAAETLHKGMKGIGKNDAMIVEVSHLTLVID